MPDRDPHSPQPRRRHRVFGWLRTSFLTGLVVIAPIGLTGYLIWTVIGWIDSWVLPFVPAEFTPVDQFGVHLRGYGVIIFLLFTILVGWIAKGLIGRSLIHWGERLVDRMPVVRSIYSGVKQIVETIFAQSDSSFEKACLIEYPRHGLWAIAFISTRTKGEIAARTGDGAEMLSVFLPTTPNPTSGFLLFVPRTDVVLLDMTVEEAAKLIISAGLVHPVPKPPTPAESGSAPRPVTG